MKLKLSEVSSGYTKNIAQKDLVNNNGSYPIYGASGYIKDVDFYVSDKPYIGIVKDGSGVGRVGLYPAYSSLLGTMQYILPKENIDIAYLMYALRKMKLGETFSGAAIPHIYYKDYRKNELNYREVSEQKAISEELSCIENTIVICENKILTLDELVKSRFIEMFGEPLQPQKSRPLGDMALLERGKFSPRPRNDPQYYNGIYPFVQTGDVANCNHRLVSYHQTLNEKGIKVSKRFSSGTILIALVGATIGATAILEIDAYAPDSLIGITPRQGVCDNVFLEILLQFWQPELKRIAPDAARANINLGILENIPIIDVDFAMQENFAFFVRKIDKLKLIVQKQIENLQELFDSKMDKYFG